MSRSSRVIKVFHRLSCVLLIIINLAIASIPFLIFHETIEASHLYLISFSLICCNTVCCLAVIITTIKRSYYDTINKLIERDKIITLLIKKLNESINVSGEVMLNSNYDPMNGLELIYEAYIDQKGDDK